MREYHLRGSTVTISVTMGTWSYPARFRVHEIAFDVKPHPEHPDQYELRCRRCGWWCGEARPLDQEGLTFAIDRDEADTHAREHAERKERALRAERGVTFKKEPPQRPGAPRT